MGIRAIGTVLPNDPSRYTFGPATLPRRKAVHARPIRARHWPPALLFLPSVIRPSPIATAVGQAQRLYPGTRDLPGERRDRRHDQPRPPDRGRRSRRQRHLESPGRVPHRQCRHREGQRLAAGRATSAGPATRSGCRSASSRPRSPGSSSPRWPRSRPPTARRWWTRSRPSATSASWPTTPSADGPRSRPASSTARARTSPPTPTPPPSASPG